MWTECHWIIQGDTEDETAGNEMQLWHSVIRTFFKGHLLWFLKYEVFAVVGVLNCAFWVEVSMFIWNAGRLQCCYPRDHKKKKVFANANIMRMFQLQTDKIFRTE
jgi:hypothetical protein